VTRLAVAIRLPAEIVAGLERLPRPSRPAVNWSVPAQWLVKLRPLGHVDDQLVDPLTEALADELAAADPATCTLGPVTERLGGQWLGVPVAGLDDLIAVVYDATVGIVAVTHPQRYRADVVVARGRVPADLAGEPVAGSWVADTVALVADRSAPGRPRLVDLAEFRLTAAGCEQ
jgi:2'-5' RNA ligase